MSDFPAPHVVVNAYRPYSVLRRHGHRGASLSLVLTGCQVDRIGRRSWQCEPLSLVYKPPNVEHSNHVGAFGLRALFMEISPENSSVLIAEWPTLSDIRCVTAASVTPSIRQLNQYLEQRSGSSVEMTDELLHDLLSGVIGSGAVRPGRSYEPWLTHVREFVHAHFDRPLSLTKAAAVGGVHPVHLAQTFQRAFGCTFMQYVREVRLDAARAGLANRTQSIAAIGLAVGFADHAHFSRAFRARFGITPTEYRDSLP